MQSLDGRKLKIGKKKRKKNIHDKTNTKTTTTHFKNISEPRQYYMLIKSSELGKFYRLQSSAGHVPIYS